MDRNQKLYQMKFNDIYKLYLNKIENKNRTENELKEIIMWLTGYDEEEVLKNDYTLERFFEKAPKLNENRHQITGSICGVKIQEIADPLMKEIRYMDKIVDELAKGKTLDKIKRN